jgi:hypothetical protein
MRLKSKTHNYHGSCDNSARFPEEYLHQLSKLELPGSCDLVFWFYQTSSRVNTSECVVPEVEWIFLLNVIN